MNDLSSEARALLDAARGADDPTGEDRVRVRRALAVAIAGAAAGGVGVVSAAAASEGVGAVVGVGSAGTGAVHAGGVATGLGVSGGVVGTGAAVTGAGAGLAGAGLAGAGAAMSAATASGAASSASVGLAVGKGILGLGLGGKAVFAVVFASAVGTTAWVAKRAPESDPNASAKVVQTSETRPTAAPLAARHTTAREGRPLGVELPVAGEPPAVVGSREVGGAPDGIAARSLAQSDLAHPDLAHPDLAYPDDGRLRPGEVTRRGASAKPRGLAGSSRSPEDGARSASPVSAGTEQPAPSSASGLDAELAHLRAAQRARLRGDGRAALAELDAAAARHPQGILDAERRATRVFVLCELGRREDAGRAATEFLARYPGSPLAERVRTACVTP